jgi:hypothetical protein
MISSLCYPVEVISHLGGVCAIDHCIQCPVIETSFFNGSINVMTVVDLLDLRLDLTVKSTVF